MPLSAARIATAVASSLALLMVASIVWLYFASRPSKDEVAVAKSPDGRFIAKLVEINGGATTSFGYLVILSELGNTPEEYEVANLYGAVRSASAYGANLRWASPQELAVEYLHAKGTELLNPKLKFGATEVTVVLRPNFTDATAPPGGMLYNLQGRRQ
jgi:hypothetical protein